MSEESKKPKRIATKRTTSPEAKTVSKNTTKRKAATKEKKISEVKVQPKPQTEPPDPIVFKRHSLSVKQKVGKGFSIGELKAVGLSLKQALKLKLKVDKRRTTVHDWNIEALQRFLGLKAT